MGIGAYYYYAPDGLLAGRGGKEQHQPNAGDGRIFGSPDSKEPDPEQLDDPYGKNKHRDHLDAYTSNEALAEAWMFCHVQKDNGTCYLRDCLQPWALTTQCNTLLTMWPKWLLSCIDILEQHPCKVAFDTCSSCKCSDPNCILFIRTRSCRQCTARLLCYKPLARSGVSHDHSCYS